MIRVLGHGLAVLVLTLLTQIGGLAWLLARAATRRRGVAAMLTAFFALYAGLSLAARLAAPAFGRVPLPCFESGKAPLASASPLYCALNRHYVTPSLLGLAEDLARSVDRAHPGTLTLTLDAGFPFLDGFPMLPHLSHDDGEKLDLAFFYRDDEGVYRRGALPSPVGYWGFEPGPVSDCEAVAGLTLRWDMGWFQPFVNESLRADDDRMRTALGWLLERRSERGIGKILLEPHLKARWAPGADIVRFQGCRAARHDDHLHLQLR